MRIVLEKGKQKELISKAKDNFSWKELGKKLKYNSAYVRNELRNEERYLSEEAYKKLCALTNEDFDRSIIKKLKDNWGQIKGANKTSRNTKSFIEPKESKELSELFGALLGDGHLEEIKIGKKIRCYSVTITGDSFNDKDYISDYISNLFEKILKEKGKIRYAKKERALFIRIHGKKIVNFIKKKGISPGNKKENNQGIPLWIKNNREYIITCLRGLIDTDGSIHNISKNNKNMRISFVSHIPRLLEDVRNSFLKLNIKTSKIIRNRQIFISGKEDIKRYIELIGFSNSKHLKRLENFRSNAPVV